MGARTICRPRRAPIIRQFLGSLFMGARVSLRSCAFVLASVTLLILASCSYFNPLADPGTLVFLMDSAPTNLDPRIGADAYSAHLDGLIFSSLVAHDAQMNVIPDLAERWDCPAEFAGWNVTTSGGKRTVSVCELGQG